MNNQTTGPVKIVFWFTGLIILLFINDIKAQRTVLYGKAPDYSTKEIIFYTISDPVLHEKSELAATTVEKDGSFSVIFSSSETIEIYSDLEKYCGTMVVEPGKNYQVALPPFTPRTPSEIHSIFFKPSPYWLGLPGTENSDINLAVRSFLTDYNYEKVKNSARIYQSKDLVNEIIERLDNKYKSIQHPYFKTLMKYSFADLENIAFQRNQDVVIQKYFAKDPIQSEHPAYQSAFELVFTDFLRKQSQNLQNKNIAAFVNSGNYQGLVNLFEKKGYRNDVAELVILKGLFDGYYSGSFNKEGIIKAVGVAETTGTLPELQSLAHKIRQKLTILAAGGKAPSLRLPNIRHDYVSLDKFKGRFVYLTFFSSLSADCRTELDSLVSIEKQLRQVLSVVSVAVDDDFNQASNLWKTKGYAWELLNGSKQRQLIQSYDASLPPVYYLISPDGTLRLSPAAAPGRGFEPVFLKILREYNFRNRPNP